MNLLQSVQYITPNQMQADTFPFSISLLQHFKHIRFEAPVTIFVGENGVGKSTLLEAIAIAAGSISAGGQDLESDPTLQHSKKLSRQLKLSWKIKTRKGFFLRAEDFLNYQKRLVEIRNEMQERLAEIEEEYKGRSELAKALAKMPFKGSLAELKHTYGGNLEASSHGESFFTFFQARFVPRGLYLLDEPETPLSPMKQLGLITMMKDMVEQGAQFIIVTHSPIIMAYPGATLLSFDHTPIQAIRYEEIEHVQLMKAFLDRPEQFLKHL